MSNTVDWNLIWNAVLSLGGALVGWMLKLVTDEQKEQRSRLNEHIVKTADIYVRKEDFTEQVDRMIRIMERIEDKVDRSRG